MSKKMSHMSRRELKRDIVLEWIERISDFFSLNKEKVGIVFIGCFLALLVIVYIKKVAVSQRENRFELLYQSQKVLSKEEEKNEVECREALKQLKKMIYRSPRSLEAFFAFLTLVQHNLKVKNYAFSLDLTTFMLKKASLNRESKSQVLFIKAIILEQMSRFQLSLKFYEKIRKRDKHSYLLPASKLGQARCLRLLNQKDKAKTCYESILSDYPQTTWAKKAKSLMSLLSES